MNVSNTFRFLQLFYGIKLGFVSTYYLNYLDQVKYISTDKVWMTKLLGGIVENSNDFSFLGLIELSLLAVVIAFPKYMSFRFLEAFISLFMFSLIISINSIGHSLHSFIIISFPLSFLTPLNGNRMLTMAMNFHLLTYFSSGFWKFAVLVRETFALNFWSYSKAALNNSIAKKALELDRPLFVIDALLSLPSVLSVLLWLSIISFQLGMIYFVFKSHYPKALGISIIIFHSLTLFFMDVNYIEAQTLTCLLFFLGVPLIKEGEKDLTNTSLEPV